MPPRTSTPSIATIARDRRPERDAGARAARASSPERSDSATISEVQILAVAGHVVDPRSGPQLSAIPECVIRPEVLREHEGLLPVAHHVSDQTPDVDRVHGARFHACRELTQSESVHAHRALADRALALGSSELGAGAPMLGRNRWLRLPIPVEHANVVGTRCHAHPASNADALVYDDDSIRLVVRRPRGAHPNPRGVLSLHAQHRHGVLQTLGVDEVVDLDPLDFLGEEMLLLTSLDAVATAVTPPQVEDHHPLVIGSDVERSGGDGVEILGRENPLHAACLESHQGTRGADGVQELTARDLSGCRVWKRAPDVLGWDHGRGAIEETDPDVTTRSAVAPGVLGHLVCLLAPYRGLGPHAAESAPWGRRFMLAGPLRGWHRPRRHCLRGHPGVRGRWQSRPPGNPHTRLREIPTRGLGARITDDRCVYTESKARSGGVSLPDRMDKPITLLIA